MLNEPQLTPEERAEISTGRKVLFTSAAAIVPLETQYAIYPYVPREEITWAEGQTGSGKTMAIADLVARMSRGDDFETEPIPKGRVAILTCEDSPERTSSPPHRSTSR